MYGSSDTARITEKVHGQFLWNRQKSVCAPPYRKVHQWCNPTVVSGRKPESIVGCCLALSVGCGDI